MTNHHPSVLALAEEIRTHFLVGLRTEFKGADWDAGAVIPKLCDLIESHLHATLLIDAVKKCGPIVLAGEFPNGITIEDKLMACQSARAALDAMETSDE